MKTAVSIPDDVYHRAERLARKMKVSRSRLFSAAIDEYVARHTDDEITEAMNEALLTIGDQTDPFLQEASRRALARTEWWSAKGIFGGPTFACLKVPNRVIADRLSSFRATI